MSEKTKPSAGALRATTIMARENVLSADEIYEAAEIIDRETGLAELLDAAKEYQQHASRPPWESKPFDHDAWLKRLEQAIAKVEGR